MILSINFISDICKIDLEIRCDFMSKLVCSQMAVLLVLMKNLLVYTEDDHSKTKSRKLIQIYHAERRKFYSALKCIQLKMINKVKATEKMLHFDL